MIIDPRVRAEVEQHPYPLLFATISGAHLYGFPSPDSDYDLRGVHILPAADVLGLHSPRDTVEVSGTRAGLKIDLVTHDAGKFFRLLLRKNGYVLEQLYSPLIVQTTPEHDELKTIARGCITRFHVYHYVGFAQTQWSLFEKYHPPRVKPLLYVYRVLLTGIHLMRTGQVEANLSRLNERFKLPFVAELIERKTTTEERASLAEADLSFHATQYARLRDDLERAGEVSSLPQAPTAIDALSDLLIRLRVRTLSPSQTGPTGPSTANG